MTDVRLAVGEVEADSSNLEAAIRRAPDVSWTLYQMALKGREKSEKGLQRSERAYCATVR